MHTLCSFGMDMFSMPFLVSREENQSHIICIYFPMVTGRWMRWRLHTAGVSGMLLTQYRPFLLLKSSQPRRSYKFLVPLDPWITKEEMAELKKWKFHCKRSAWRGYSSSWPCGVWVSESFRWWRQTCRWRLLAGRWWLCLCSWWEHSPGLISGQLLSTSFHNLLATFIVSACFCFFELIYLNIL